MLATHSCDFDKYFEDVVSILYDSLDDDLKPAKEHFVQVCKYNVPDGKKMRGRFCVVAFKVFAKENPSETLIRMANLVGWSIELLQAGFLVHDDIIDCSPMRRGKTSWGLLQQQKGLGMIGVNDGLHLVFAVNQLLLSTLYQKHPLCLEILKLFMDSANFTCFGQALDILGDIHSQTPINTSQISADRLKNATVKRFASVAKWKTSYYSFVLPVLAGMLLAKVTSKKLLENAKAILFKIGEYFQAQDDYLDVYGDVKVTGKVGTDIADGKCSWVIGTALEHASTEQKAVLAANYGVNKPECVEAVRKIFDQIDIPRLYTIYEETTRTEILRFIDCVCEEKSNGMDFSDPEAEKLPRGLFVELLDTFYRRQK